MMCWRNGVLVNWKNDDLFSFIEGSIRFDRIFVECPKKVSTVQTDFNSINRYTTRCRFDIFSNNNTIIKWGLHFFS